MGWSIYLLLLTLRIASSKSSSAKVLSSGKAFVMAPAKASAVPSAALCQRILGATGAVVRGKDYRSKSA